MGEPNLWVAALLTVLTLVNAGVALYLGRELKQSREALEAMRSRVGSLESAEDD